MAKWKQRKLISAKTMITVKILEIDSDANQHWEEVCDKNGLSLIKRGRSRHRKSFKEKRKNRDNIAPPFTGKEKQQHPWIFLMISAI